MEQMESVYSVHGPFRVPTEPLKKIRWVNENKIKQFWQEDDRRKKLKDGRGCYVFAIQAGPGYTPWYVGEATKGFGQECFSERNLLRYNRVVANQTGSPVLFLVAHPTKIGPTRKIEIRNIERYFTELGAVKNPNLLNKQGKRQPKWTIKGVIRGRQGQPSREAKAFKKLFGLSND